MQMLGFATEEPDTYLPAFVLYDIEQNSNTLYIWYYLRIIVFSVIALRM